MKRKNEWIYHLIVGVVTIIIHYVNHYVYNGREALIEDFTYPTGLTNLTFFISFFSVYFLNYYLVCPKTIAKKRIGLFVGAIVLLMLLYAGIRFLLEEIIGYQLTGFHNYADSKRVIGYYLFDNSYYALKAILFSTTLYLVLQYIDHNNKIHRLQIENKKAELSALKNQLEPHFLFNTLNAFYTELVDTEPKVAKNIHKLSELLRYVTYESKKDVVPLATELNFIEDYIGLNRTRFEDNIFLDVTIEGKVEEQKIVPLVLIHFVENIFKHGVLTKKESPARIEIQFYMDYITISTSNEVANVKSYSGQGIGRENLIRRLELIFKDQYRLDYHFSESRFETFLKIPLK